MAKQNTVAVAVKTALGVTFETLKAQVDVMGIMDKKHSTEKHGSNQLFSEYLNVYFVTAYGITNWHLEDTVRPITLAQKQIRDTYNSLLKYNKDRGYKLKFAQSWAQARKYAPAMLLEGKEREAALAAIQAERVANPEARTAEEIFTYRMKGDKKEWGDLAVLYRKAASIYFAPEDTRIKTPDPIKKKVFATMGILEEGLKMWGINPATILAKK